MIIKNKLLVLLTIFSVGIYLFINTIIGKDNFKNFKSLLNEEKKLFLKEYIFPYKLISEKKIDILQLNHEIITLKENISQLNQIIIIKSDGKKTFELSENNSLFFYSKDTFKMDLTIKAILKDKEITCYHKSNINNSYQLNISEFSEDCKKAIFFIGDINGNYFYFGLKQKAKNSKNLLILPASNFYNYSSNLFEINQYSAKEDYIAKLDEVPLHTKMKWAERTSKSIHNISKIINEYDIILDYQFLNFDINDYDLIILPLHQEYVSNEFVEKLIDYLKNENRVVFSIGGANFKRHVEFKDNYFLYEKNKEINVKDYNLNTFDEGINKNCVYVDDKNMNLGELTEPLVKQNIEYLFPKIKCENDKFIPLLSIQSFDNKKNSKFIHILSDGIGMNFATIEYLKTQILNKINNIIKD